MITSSQTEQASRAAQPRQPSRWKRILAVIETTSGAQSALEKAVRIALLAGSSLELYVCDVQQQIPDSWAGGPDRYREYRDILRQRALSDLRKFAEPLSEDGLSVTTHHEWQAPPEGGIGPHAIRTGADLVVKEAHPHDPMAESRFTRTDWNLVAQLPCDVLLVRPTTWRSAPRIAAAIDPLHPADRPVELDEKLIHAGRALADLLRGSLEVFHVLQTPPHLPGERVADDVRATAELRARGAVEMLARQAGARVFYEAGLPCEGLLRLARPNAPDILIMGVAARPRPAHAPAGETAVRVLERVGSDLLVLKPPGFVSQLLITD